MLVCRNVVLCHFVCLPANISLILVVWTFLIIVQFVSAHMLVVDAAVWRGSAPLWDFAYLLLKVLLPEVAACVLFGSGTVGRKCRARSFSWWLLRFARLGRMWCQIYLCSGCVIARWRR